MLTIILGLVAIATFVFYYIVKPLNYWKERGVKHAKAKWVFGHTFGALTHKERWTDMLVRVYSHSPGTRYTGLYNFHYPILVIKDAELLKHVTIKDFDHFTDRIAFLPPGSDPLFEKNLLGLKGRMWRETRALLSPSLTGSKLRSMFGLMQESAENFVQHFLKKDEDTFIVEMKDTFARFSTDLIATTACGVKVDSLAERNNEFYLMGQDAIDFGNTWKNIKFILYRIIPSIKKVLKVQLFSDKVTIFFRGLIDETIRVREENGVVRPDMIQLLLEVRKEANKQGGNNDTTRHSIDDLEIRTLSNEDITAHALAFFVGGFDSVASLMCFTAYELALNQDIQERLREEVRSTWKSCGGQLTYDAVMHMKYIDMVLSESLRKWPSAIAVDRACTKPYTIEPTLPGEIPIHLKVNDGIWLPIYAIHRDPNYYPNPERFDPERFNEENKGNIKPCSFLPFGLGPRGCLAPRMALLETKIIFYHILLHFELVPVEKTPIPIVLSKKTIALNAEGGIWLGLKKIKREYE